jgi:hypothetical protein
MTDQARRQNRHTSSRETRPIVIEGYQPRAGVYAHPDDVKPPRGGSAVEPARRTDGKPPSSERQGK